MRILIVDDHKLFAEAIRVALEASGAEVCGLASSGSDALALARLHRPDAVLLDLGLPNESGLRVGRAILEEVPETLVIAVTALADPQVAREALKLGFRGFLTKDTPVTSFVESVRTVLNGQVVVSPNLARGAAGHQTPEEEQASLLAAQLTVREREILGYLVQGVSGNADIARRLHVSPNTVRTHVQSVLSKLQVHSRLEAAAFAVRHGIVDIPRSRGGASA